VLLKPGLRSLLGSPAFSLYGRSGNTYLPESKALFAAMTTPPALARKVLIDTTIRALIDGGYWATRDSIWFEAAHSEQAALLDWKRVNDLTKVNTPTFTTDRGFTSTSGTNIISVASATTANASQNDLAFGTYRLSQSAAGAGNGTLRGSTASVSARHDSVSNTFRVNDGTASPFTHTVAMPDHIILRRNAASGAGSKSIWIDGAARASLNVASTGDFTGSVVFGHGNNDLHAAGHIGAYLNDAGCAGLTAIIESYLTAVGAI